MSISSIMEIWDSVLYSFYNIVVGFLYLIKYPRIRIVVKKNKLLKDAYRGRRCFIVLNGPSVTRHNLSKLREEIVFATNYFYRAPLSKVVNPNFYCWLDAKIFGSEDGERVLTEIQGSAPDAHILLNYKAFKIRSNGDKLHYVFTKAIPHLFSVKTNIGGLCSNFSTVAFFAISAAIYMGFSKIYILGLDFEPGGFTHFTNLGEDAECERTDNKIKKEEVCGLHWGYVKAQYESFYINKIANKMGCKIINLNPDSCIRSFEFNEYEKII